MTVVETTANTPPTGRLSRGAHALPARQLSRNRVWQGAGICAVPLVLVGLAVALRVVNLPSSYDLFIDEGFYTAVGQSVAGGHLPYTNGHLFFLHPPGHSLLEAVWIHLLNIRGGFFQQVFAMRYLNVVFAAVTTLMLYLFGRRVSGSAAGVVAAILFAVSPWFIRQNSFVLLETSAMAFVLAGWLTLLHLPTSRRPRALTIVGIGLLFGFGVLVKEFAGFVTAVPFAILMWRQWVVSRREALTVLLVTAVPYGSWVLIVLFTGNFAEFWRQSTSGFRRAAGAQQLSGFNSPKAPSFLSTVIGNAPQFWTTYLLMGVGSVALLWLLVRGSTVQRRVLAAFGVGAIPLLAYSVLLGANEEQFYYYLLIPAALAVGVVLRDQWKRPGERARKVVVALAMVWVVSDLANWVIVHTTADNGAQQVDQWMYEHVRPGTAVGVTNSVQREIFRRYDMVDVSTPASLQGRGVRYLVVFEKQVAQGYAFTTPDALAAVVGSKHPVFSTTVRGNGRIDVFQLA